MGMTKQEIKSKFDEIVEFAGVGKYIDTPVKRYSSGMYVRLAFAVAAHLEPEILIVDEVLAVGDAEFQKKAIGKMQNVSRNQGRTVLFVSHNMGALKNLCKTGLLLQNGKIIQSGGIDTVLNSYINQNLNASPAYYPENNIVKEIKAYQFKDKIYLALKYKSEKPIKQPNFGFIVYDNHDNPIFGTNAIKNGILNFGVPKHEGEINIEISSPYLVNGSYPISIWFSDGIAHGEHIFHVDKCISIQVVDMYNNYIEKNSNQEGVIIPSCDWTFK
jgi:lipopolysaccharide transport system ATP-binding protein